MTVAILFTLAIALILFRAFVLHLRSTDLDNEKFVVLPREVKLAILKERVLETPSEKSLNNLETFLKSEGIEVDMESYRPLYTEQLKLSGKENAIALDNDLYTREAAWMDAIEPFEFAEALKLKEEGKTEEFIHLVCQYKGARQDCLLQNAGKCATGRTHSGAPRRICQYRPTERQHD